MGKRNGSCTYSDTECPQIESQGSIRLKVPIIAISLVIQIFFALSLPAQCANSLFVDQFATGTGNGLSWTNAFTDLQVAMDSARICGSETLFVAAGIYRPDRGTDNQDSTFNIIDGVVMLGGFPTGGGTRDPVQFPTILSGDLDSAGLDADNSFHVVTGRNLTAHPIIDGFVIRDGYSLDVNQDGGGLRFINSNAILRNCTVQENSARNGGGIFSSSNSSLLIYDCTFFQNQASRKGGAYADSSTTNKLVNCLFRDNFAALDGGGCVFSNSNSMLLNTSFLSNNCIFNGGGLANDTATTSIINCSFNNNTGVQGGAMLNFDSAPLLANTICWGNIAFAGYEVEDLASATRVENCIIKGRYDTPPSPGYAINVRDVDPRFKTNGFNLRIRNVSPAINAGTPVRLVPDTLDFDQDGDSTEFVEDLDGGARLRFCAPDIGAFEFQGRERVYVDSAAVGTNDGNTWANAFTSLVNALKDTLYTDSILIASGTYYPTTNPSLLDTAFRFRSCQLFMGGFPSGGGNNASRNYSTHPTRLSGAIGTGVFSHNVVNASGADSTCIVDGLIIEDGNANGTGGIYNTGGGLVMQGGNPLFRHCTFRDNNSSNAGAGVAVLDSASPTFLSCLFQNNNAPAGGAMLVRSSFPELMNCTLYGNGATTITRPGGILAENNSGVSLVNCLIWENDNMQILDQTGSQTVAGFSLIQGGWPGSSNIAQDPDFENAPGDLRLKACSPAIDAGDTALLPPGLDLAGNPRVFNQTDIGVYELQETPVPYPVPDLGPDTSYCASQGITLEPDPGTSYPGAVFFWNTPSGPDTTTNGLIANSAGQFTLVLRDTNGCEGHDTLQLGVFQDPVPSLGPDTTVCLSDSTLLDPGNFASYLWSTQDTTPTINYSQPGLVSVTVIDVNGCVGSDTLLIQNHPSPQPTIVAPSGTIVCRNSTVTLQVQQTYGNYLWSNGMFGQQTLVDTSGIFSVIVFDSLGCQGTDSFAVTYRDDVAGPSTVLLRSGPADFCNGDSLRLDAGAGFFGYCWFPGGDSSQRITVYTPGEWWVTVSNGFGCQGNSDTVVTDVFPRPVPSLAYSNDSLYSGPASTYQWNKNGVPLAGETQSTLYMPPYGSGGYSVTITDTTGCDSTSDVFMFVGIQEPGQLFGIQVYPNPTRGEVMIHSLEGILEPVKVEVRNLLGQRVHQADFTHLTETVRLGLSDLPAGLYTVRVATSGAAYLQKIHKK